VPFPAAEGWEGDPFAERVGGFPSPPMAAPSPAGNDTVSHGNRPVMAGLVPAISII
jgi:hypothetical protein